VSQKTEEKDTQLVGFLGVGLDNEDGHQRLTRTKHFFLFGGSAETHERMQDTAGRFNEALDDRGKQLSDASADEVIELLRKAMES
jgi:hypothetical protein